ncbi:MAG: NAD(P)-binding domain-containing protein, partial [Alphaproteobacteria bacterium]
MALEAGVIGLGNIGGGVARNLAAAGYSVIGYDIDTDLISARGVREAEDAAEVAENADLVVLAINTMPAWRSTLA